MKYTPCLNDKCFFTDTDSEYCEVHHIFFGNPNRKLSEKYGMKVYLVPKYHREHPHGVHRNRQNDLKVKRYAQARFEEEHSREEFMEIFGRSYL